MRIEIVHRCGQTGSRTLLPASVHGTTNHLKGTEGTVLFRRADFADNKARLLQRRRMG
jgi:hypothetical protein